ncbi:MAG TPA: glycerol-3-phosphate dehydrogenase [Rhodanobacteraceae bacterium]
MNHADGTPDIAQAPVDLLVVGGGINGTAIARDAAGRGLSVCLCEADDLAAHTSSASTKLIHGGLRYLEQYEFRLVSEALIEREVLLATAPHLIRPLRFVLVHEPHLRPAWMIRLGLFLYDHLDRGRRTLPSSRRINLASHAAGHDLKADFRTGFVYSDTQVQDARLTVLNAMDALAHGARILTRTRVVHAERGTDGWTASLSDGDGRHTTVHARMLVNATGPWAVHFLDEVAHFRHSHALRLVKGSHIVVPRLVEHDFAYTFQLPDRRIVFAIPYQRDFTLIGTTDVDYRGDPSRLAISADETAYLCDAVNRHFRRQITPDDVRWSYAGVRPLVEDEEASAAEVTRGYRLEENAHGAPLLSVFGGKITTARRLAEEALDKLAPHHARRRHWTAHAPLPGGERRDIDTFQAGFMQSHPWLPPALATRLVRSYGTRAPAILGKASSLADLGPHFGAGLYAAEVDYLRHDEWAQTADDILWRRGKLGLRLSTDETGRLDGYLHSS